MSHLSSPLLLNNRSYQRSVLLIFSKSQAVGFDNLLCYCWCFLPSISLLWGPLEVNDLFHSFFELFSFLINNLKDVNFTVYCFGHFTIW